MMWIMKQSRRLEKVSRMADNGYGNIKEVKGIKSKNITVQITAVGENKEKSKPSQ